MGKYESLQTSVFSIFGTQEWEDEDIKTYPSNFVPKEEGEFVRVNIIPSGNGLSLGMVSGVLILDIFVEYGNGPTRTSEVADRLDEYLVGKYIDDVQLLDSTLTMTGKDADNPALFMSQYTIPFNFYGV